MEGKLVIGLLILVVSSSVLCCDTSHLCQLAVQLIAGKLSLTIDVRSQPENLTTEEDMYLSYVKYNCSDILEKSEVVLPCEVPSTTELITGVKMLDCETECEINGTIIRQIAHLYLQKTAVPSGYGIPGIMLGQQPPLLPIPSSRNTNTTTAAVTTEFIYVTSTSIASTNVSQHDIGHDLDLHHHSKHVKYALEGCHLLSGCLFFVVGIFARGFSIKKTNLFMNIAVLSVLLSISMLIQGIMELLDIRDSSRAVLHIVQQYMYYMAGVSCIIIAAFLNKIKKRKVKASNGRPATVTAEESSWFGCVMLTVIIPYFYMAPLPFIDNYLVRGRKSFMLSQVLIDLYGEPPPTLAAFMELNLLSIVLYVILVVTAIKIYMTAGKNQWLSLSTCILLLLGLLVPVHSQRKFSHNYQSLILLMEPAWSYIELIISLLVPILVALFILTLVKAVHFESLRKP